MNTVTRLIPEENVHTLDLNFQSLTGAIAVYVIPHSHGAVLVESGPASTLTQLESGLRGLGIGLDEISDVLLTHIHLDHGGAAGHLAQNGARVHVHPVGAPHLIDPGKLLSSARRLYGDDMDALWGETLPVPAEMIRVAEHDQVVEIEGLCFKVIDTPGHASHHNAYLLEGMCFSGDVGGVRLSGLKHVRAPMVPPEFQPEVWRQSIKSLAQEQVRWIAPTHFGFFKDPAQHLARLDGLLKNLESWMENNLNDDPDIKALNRRYNAWIEHISRDDNLTDEQVKANEAANPSWLSPLGIQRYWRKRNEGGASK